MQFTHILRMLALALAIFAAVVPAANNAFAKHGADDVAAEDVSGEGAGHP